MANEIGAGGGSRVVDPIRNAGRSVFGIVSAIFSIKGLAAIFIIINIFYFLSKIFDIGIGFIDTRNLMNSQLGIIRTTLSSVDSRLENIIQTTERPHISVVKISTDGIIENCIDLLTDIFSRNGATDIEIVNGIVKGTSRDMQGILHALEIRCNESDAILTAAGANKEFVNEISGEFERLVSSRIRLDRGNQDDTDDRIILPELSIIPN